MELQEDLLCSTWHCHSSHSQGTNLKQEPNPSLAVTSEVKRQASQSQSLSWIFETGNGKTMMKVYVKEGRETALEDMRRHEQARIRKNASQQQKENEADIRKLIESYKPHLFLPQVWANMNHSLCLPSYILSSSFSSSYYPLLSLKPPSQNGSSFAIRVDGNAPF